MYIDLDACTKLPQLPLCVKYIIDLYILLNVFIYYIVFYFFRCYYIFYNIQYSLICLYYCKIFLYLLNF